MPHLLERKHRRDSAVDAGDVDGAASIEYRAALPCSSLAERAAVLEAIEETRASIDGDVLPAAPIIDRLIDIWSLTRRVDPALTKPVEVILSALAGREAISAVEVRVACDQIEKALATTGRSHVA